MQPGTNGVDVHPQATQPTRVVGIGASAGGLEALEDFFGSLPTPSGMAFVVVQHLSPDFKSMMSELLARHTTMPVRLVEDGVRVEANSVYLIPPGKEMIIAGGRLLLSERDTKPELTLPIDTFFRSLAQDCGDRSVAIILSGAGADGSRGVREVHDEGGLVLVQEAESAQFDGMPRTAIDSGVADWVLSPRDMPRILLEEGERGRPSGLRAEPGDAPGQGLDAVYKMLEREFGIDFTDYKPSTVTRRIERRLTLAAVGDIDRYVEQLRERREELDTLYRDLLIGVTRFFRNEEAFQLLGQQVLPDLLRRGPRDAPLRIWVAGCATGEEAYSLAIVAHEAAANTGRAVKIFATDVHNGSLEKAARGVYDEQALSNVPSDLIDKYFHRSGGAFQVVPEIRQLIVFAPHNVIRDAPFTRVDLVSCRNMLIYLQQPAQQRALSLFHFALNRGGTLFLGPSETPGHLDRDYEPIDKHWRIYRKVTDVRVPVGAKLKPARPMTPRLLASAVHPERPGGYSLSQLVSTYDTLLDRMMPPSLLLTESGQVLHAFAGASRFLRPHDGRQGLDVRDLVGDDLKTVLAAAMKRAASEERPMVFNGVRLADAESQGIYRVTVHRLPAPKGGTPHLVASFELTSDRTAPPVDPARAPVELSYDPTAASYDHLALMEAELASTRESLQAAIEQLEASNEELQASNEELLASNEELQSTNEELQSVNEELYTVNAEHQRKIAELVELTNDVNNLLSSTDIGTIFLDAELKVRKFTPQVAQAFRLVPHDVGRHITTFAHTLRHPGLLADLQQCLATGERVERELTDVNGRAYFMRVLPYRAKSRIEGVVLTLIDVSSMKATEDALFHERHLLESLVVNVPDAVYFKDARGLFVRANPAMAARLGVDDPQNVVGRTEAQIVGDHVAQVASAAEERVLAQGQPQHYALEERTRPDGSRRWELVTRLPMHDRSGAIVGVVGIVRDVTREKDAEASIQKAVKRRDEFLAMLSHELRNPLSAIVTATRLLQKPDTGGRERLLQTLERQTGQMTRLLDDLLDASRVTQDKIELKRVSCDLRAVAREAIDATRPSMDGRGIQLTVEMAPEPVMVFGDPARLQQVHVNLLSNASKYTPRGGRVLVHIGSEGDRAVVRVRDDGAGIRADMLDAVFEMFVQGHTTRDRADGGLGVGLALVRSLVQKHGGTAHARSDGPGKGSEFVVELPLAAAPAVLQAPPKRAPAANAPLKVAIIEDNEDSRHMLCYFLEDAGHVCKTAGSGAAGLELFDDWGPDVGIVDIGLPEMDGLEVARRLRQDDRHASTYLIALTGYGQTADTAATRAAGFDTHMVKPVDLDRLLGRIAGERESAKDDRSDGPAAG